MAIRRPTLLLGKQLRITVGGGADEATRKLTAAWVTAWNTLSGDMESAVMEALALAGRLDRWPTSLELMRVDRIYRTMLAAQDSLVGLSRLAGVTITDAAGRAVKATADAEPGIIASQYPAAGRAAALLAVAKRINPSALDIIVTRTTQQITSTLWPLAGEATSAMHRELVRGVALGSSPRQAGAEMLRRLEGAFEGGLSRAINVARTEILDAYRGVSAYAHQANSDILSGWIWLATLSNRTCPSCIALNGSVHPLSEPGPLDHQSGRCARMPALKPWAELGITTPEPAHTIPDARAWFAAQPATTQAQILGPGRLALLDSGAIGWDDIPQQRNTPAWRPSYTPASLTDLRKAATRRA